MRFRFVLSHAIEGSLEIDEMDGWKDAVMKLERHDDFHSLIEYFDGSFIFYGNNGTINGGLDFIKNIEQTYGLDETITIDIDLTFDEVDFTNVFNGQFKLTDLEEMVDNKMRLPIIRDDFWAKFISRLDTPVNLRANTNLDDEPKSETEYINLNLPSQKIRYQGEYNWLYSETYREQLNHHGLQLDWEEVVIDDIKKFTLPRVTLDIGNTAGIATNLIGNFEAPYDGDYTLDIRIEAAEYGAGNWFFAPLNFFVQNVNDQSQTDPFDVTTVTYGSDTIMVFSYNKTLRLRRGDQLAIYGDRDATSDEITIFGSVRLDWKTNAAVATRTNIVLSGEQTIDGVLTSNSRVLVKNQGNREENGIYVSSAGAWSRATDADSVLDLINAAVYVTGGSTQADTAWRQDEEITALGTDPVIWTFTFDSDERFAPYPGDEVDNHLIITADTTYKPTDAAGFLLHDVGAAICDRIIGESSTFYSELLGSQHTLMREYVEDGCAWAYGLFKGLQLRQYSLDEKPFFLSFNQWWKGINPILNLSLAYETVQIPELVDVSPDVNLLEDLDDWSNAPGSTWDFITFGYPFVSVNGAGGVEGYAVSTITAVALTTYTFDTILNIASTGSETPTVVITWAILDSGFNEIDTITFNYSGAGNKVETFNLTPNANGAYFGVKIENNTPTETKNFSVTYAFSEAPQVVYHEETVIRVEDKAGWYDDSQGTSIDFSNVRTITRKYDNDRIFNKVSIGYARWQSEDISGIDDPQTKKTYATRFQKVGKPIELYSEFIAASLAIESTRRTTREKSSDYKFDNETFIIALNPTVQDESPDTSPDILQFIPELDENFTSVSGLLNSETRYNLKLTPARNFLRWQNFLQGALQSYLGSNFKFSSAEGNYDMISTMEVNGCLNEDYNGQALDEKGDIEVTADYLHLTQLYEVTIPMEWDEYETIRNNRKKPVGISLTDVDHVSMFIKELSYKPVKGTCEMLLWAKEYLDLSRVADTTPMQECMPSSDECENALTDSFGNILTDELGVCITE